MGILIRRAAVCLVTLLVARASLSAGDDSLLSGGHSEEEIKSAMLYTFTKFVEWPAAAREEHGARLVIGVLGNDPLIPVLEAVLRDKTVHGHPIVVRRLDASSDLGDCLVLFVGVSDRKRIVRILQSVGRSPTLTIGDHIQFSRLGGVIAFIRDGNRIRFEINLDAAGRAGLQISSKLLRLASVFRERPARARN